MRFYGEQPEQQYPEQNTQYPNNNGYYQNPQEQNYDNGYYRNPIEQNNNFQYNQDLQQQNNYPGERMQKNDAKTKQGGSSINGKIIGTVLIAVLIMFVVVLMLALGGSFSTEAMLSMVPYLILGIFFITGIVLLVGTLIGNKNKKARCTVPVNAVVVDLIYVRAKTGGHRSYAPLYEYNFNGVIYREREKIATNVGLPQVGSQMTIYVNEKDPTDFYSVWKSKNVLPIMLSIAFIVLPAFVMFSMLSSYFTA